MNPRSLASSLLVLAVTGCAVGPDFETPKPPSSRSYLPEKLGSDSVGADQRFVEGMDISGQWWSLFGSPALNALVDHSLRANPTLEAARAALIQAQELRKAQWGAFLPLLSGDLSANRNKNAGGSIANPSTNNQAANYYSYYTAQLNLSYMPDFWGATRRGAEIALSQEDAARYQWAAAELSLSTNVVAAALQEALLRAEITATERMIVLQHKVTELLRAGRRIGTASQLDLLAQEAAEAQTLALLPPLKKQLDQTRDALAALAGKLPDEGPGAEFRLSDLTLPADLPVTLPAKLVEQRPDIRAAEENLHQASAQVGIAISDMLPQIGITGNIGTTGLKTSQLFHSNYGFWSLGTNLSQVLFDSGALLHRRRAADAALDQAASLYRQAVITAFQNVADSLRALQADAAEAEAAAAAAGAANASLTLAQQQYKLGTIALPLLLTAEQTALQAEMARVQAVATRYIDTAGLFQALGGGCGPSRC